MKSYVKKYADFDGNVHFAWNFLKSLVFEDFHFYMFLFFPKPTAQGSRCVGSVSRSRLRIARRQLPYHWQALLGSSMGPKTQRRHVNDTVGDVARGKPYHWQAFAASCIFRRRTANDAVVTTDCGLPHHWHAFRHTKIAADIKNPRKARKKQQKHRQKTPRTQKT